MTQTETWISITQEIPINDSIVKIKLIDGTIHDVCQFDEHRHNIKKFMEHGARFSTEDPIKIESYFQEFESIHGKYAVCSWKGNTPTNLNFNDIESFQYIHKGSCKRYFECEICQQKDKSTEYE